MTASGSANPPRSTYVVMAAVILVALVAGTWFIGETRGWSSIGTGGKNARIIPRVGEQAPELVTFREDGEPFILSKLRGQPVWLNFWGSWCGPCRSEMPEISRAYDTLAPQGLQIISISMGESPENAISYRNTVGAHLPVYIDPKYIESFLGDGGNADVVSKLRSMRQDWQINNYPTHIFIDGNGIVRHVVMAQLTYDDALQYAGSIMPNGVLPGASPSPVADSPRSRKST